MVEERTLPVSRGASANLLTHTIRVEVVDGPDKGLVSERPGPELKIGTGRGCDLVLKDPTVSRLHLRVHIDGGSIRVVDAGSRNGTALDGNKVRDAWARPDSLIALGATTLRLRMLGDLVELPLSTRERFGALFGRSVAMRRVFGLLERVAPTETTVLLEGETGTGKELAAEGIHEESDRAGGPFVVFDCSAVTASLLESELLGHVKGAFTGASADRVGALEAADGGTLFLDEIGELPLELQPKLLRALERREVRRVGSNATRKVDVRIVAATNRSLLREVDRGRFRDDLYYRVAVILIELPPLRERLDDVPLLAARFAEQLARGGASSSLPESVIGAFAGRAWPGNVRELRNAVARALSFGGAAPGGPPSSPATPTIDLAEPLLAGRQRTADAFERAYLELALAEAGGNVSRAAELAAVNRKFIQRAMKRHGLGGGPEARD